MITAHTVVPLTACKLKSAWGRTSEETAREQSTTPSSDSGKVIASDQRQRRWWRKAARKVRRSVVGFLPDKPFYSGGWDSFSLPASEAHTHTHTHRPWSWDGFKHEKLQQNKQFHDHTVSSRPCQDKAELCPEHSARECTVGETGEETTISDKPYEERNMPSVRLRMWFML